MVRGYKEGMEYFLRGEYAQAIDCFEEGTGFGESSECLLRLYVSMNSCTTFPESMTVYFGRNSGNWVASVFMS